jgi:phosphoribosylformylglycinamidine synthase
LDVRIGKHIRVDLEATDLAAAEAKIEHACQKLLANPIMETYSFRIEAS